MPYHTSFFSNRPTTYTAANISSSMMDIMTYLWLTDISGVRDTKKANTMGIEKHAIIYFLGPFDAAN